MNQKKLLNNKKYIDHDNIKYLKVQIIGCTEFRLLGQAYKVSHLYGKAHGNNQIRNYCTYLITRFKSLENRRF